MGTVLNFAAYTFAPPILVTPLGFLSVLIGSVPPLTPSPHLSLSSLPLPTSYQPYLTNQTLSELQTYHSYLTSPIPKHLPNHNLTPSSDP